MRCWLWLL